MPFFFLYFLGNLPGYSFQEGVEGIFIGDKTMPPLEDIHAVGKGSRVYFLDNLRTFMVFLVVVIHCGLVYEDSGIGAFFWIVDDPAVNRISGAVNIVLDIFVMATVFFISGYVTPLSLGSKSKWVFLKTKLKRLMVPWGLAVLTLIPLYKVIFLHSRGLPQEHWTTYFHFTNGLYSQNWLWFLPVLFLFNMLYLGAVCFKLKLPKRNLKAAIVAVFFLGFSYSLTMDRLNARGWTKSFLLDFQNERLFIYFMMFLLGATFYERGAFSVEPKGKKRCLAVLCTAWMPVALYRVFLVQSFVYPGVFKISETADLLLLWFFYHLSLLCLMTVTISTFWFYLDRAGRVSRELNTNAISIYILHTVILGGFALLMLPTTLPSLWKYVLSVLLTYAACHVLACLYRKTLTLKTEMRMNRKGIIQMKATSTAMLLVTLIAFVGCERKGNSEAKEASPPKPPRVNLHLAALQGNVEAIQQHIAVGSDINVKDAYGSCPLAVAATFGRTEAAKTLIDAGADLEVPNSDGSTPLHIAAFLCRTEIVKALLEKGANKNAVNQAGATAQQSVAGPFEDVKVAYDAIGHALKPLGLRLDYERIKATRPQIAEMLSISGPF
jgi:hypothetical protein